MVACLTHELLLNTGPSRAQPVRSFTDGEGGREREGGGSTIERQERAEPKSEVNRRTKGKSVAASAAKTQRPFHPFIIRGNISTSDTSAHLSSEWIV